MTEDTDAETAKPWPEGVQPTPAQALDWLRTCTVDEGEQALQRMWDTSDRAYRCFTENHDGLLRELEALRKPVVDAWQRGYEAGYEDAKAQALGVFESRA